MASQSRITFLNLSIGRGHPFYLEGIVEAINRSGKISLVRSVEEVTQIVPWPSRQAWKWVDWLYRHGSSPGFLATTYNRLRHQANYNNSRWSMSLLAAGLKSRFSTDSQPVVVSHPILVGILRGRKGIIYQHGEMVAPRESLVSGAELIIVPTQAVADQFASIGYDPSQILVSGLCIEPAIVRQAADAFTARIDRFGGDQPLTGAFFSSGAEPRDHVEQLIAAAVAAASMDQRVIIFARQSGRLAQLTVKAFERRGMLFSRLDASAAIPADLPPVLLAEFENRREEVLLSCRLFREFDYLVSPAHERTNWALGLGVPMFILEPSKGSFAPLNRQLLLNHEVAFSLSSMNHAASLGVKLESLRNRGALLAMARAGWRRYDISGFETIAAFLASRFDRPTDSA
ncbi:MAG: hypothetical protein NDJ18_00260 [candidate division Zixibacteria bacterium]|nr:hypothetical protein [candidate division Zixibacteria bacterium]